MGANHRLSETSDCPSSPSSLPSSSSSFEVSVRRNACGLGFSIACGDDSLVRIKKVFPMQPAWQTGRLRVGDVIVSADGIPLAGLPLRRALDVLRSGQNITSLVVCRVESLDKDIGAADRKISIGRSFSHAGVLGAGASEPLDNDSTNISNHLCNYGEFSVTLTKVNGSLGFTLTRADSAPFLEDGTRLRHSVKALVKEPAISDGRIRPGDKLISANGVECDALDHAELIPFLRKCPATVTLRLYRDTSRSQTPLTPDAAAAAELDLDVNAFLNSKPRRLRHEAVEMVRSLQASRTSLEKSCSPVGSLSRTHHHRSLGSQSPHRGRQKSPMVESPMSPQALESRSLPPLYLIEAATERLTIEEMLTTDVDEENDVAATEFSVTTEDDETTDADGIDSAEYDQGIIVMEEEDDESEEPTFKSHFEVNL